MHDKGGPFRQEEAADVRYERTPEGDTRQTALPEGPGMTGSECMTSIGKIENEWWSHCDLNELSFFYDDTVDQGYHFGIVNAE